MTMSFPSQPPHRTASTGSHLGRLLDDLVARAAQARKAAVISRDGFALGVSAGLSREDAEHLSALAAGLQSLANGGAIHFGGGKVHQTVIEMERGFLFVTAAGEGSCLAVLATPHADAGLLGYEMSLVVKRLVRRETVAGWTAPSSSSSPR